MKKRIQALFQQTLGFERYLAFFAWFKIHTLRWDSPEQEGDFNFFKKLLKPTDQVLDIGANIGIMTVLMAKRCPQGHVFSFEPIPANLSALKRMVHHFGLNHVSVFQMALGHEKGQLRMAMPVIEGVKMQGLTHVIHDSIEGYPSDYDTFEVPVQPLDELSFLWEKGVDAIKIDVENFERFVLQGATQLISEFKPIIYCELLPGINRTYCLDLLSSHGYQAFILDRAAKSPKLKPFEPGVDIQHNFFFIHPEGTK